MQMIDVSCKWTHQPLMFPVGTKIAKVSVIDEKNRYVQIPNHAQINWIETNPICADIVCEIEDLESILNFLKPFSGLIIHDPIFNEITLPPKKFDICFPRTKHDFSHDSCDSYIFHFDDDTEHITLPHYCDGWSNFENISRLTLHGIELNLKEFDSTPLCPLQYDQVHIYRKNLREPIKIKGWFFVDRSKVPLATSLQSDGSMTWSKTT